MSTDAMTAYDVCFAVPDLEAAMGDLRASGVRIEAVDAAQRESFLSTWASGD